ncbi:MAG: hypothetical protein MJ134_07835 [Lachnospiraceae bacterium]|nr:hypothetical protein [Lachnospiraceae bacterium]
MSKEKIGFQTLVKTIGEQFFREHESSAVYSYGEEDQGLFCFLGIDLHPSFELNGLSAKMDDWDIYASCYVTETQVIMDKCRLP